MGFDSDFQKPIAGSFTAASQTLDISSPNQTVSIVQVTGTWIGALVVEGSNDNVNFLSVPAIESTSNILASEIVVSGMFVAQTNGYQYLRLRSPIWTSGTAVITVYGSDAASLISAISLLRGGTDGTIIGNTGDALNVVITNPASTPGLDTQYNEISSIASGSETSLISITATGGGYRVSKIYVSGENIALFKIKVNGVTRLAKRTFFGNLNEDFSFDDTESGLKLSLGDILLVTVLHNRPFTANFESTILGVSL